MRLTPAVLKQYKACESGIQFIEKHYPDGVELSEILKHPHLPEDFVHWGYENLSLSKQETQLYLDYFQIVNSNALFKSKKVLNSDFVSESYQVVNSKRIEHSSKITRSHEIFYSTNVKDSSFIYRSREIEDSYLVISSSRIIKSKNISQSQRICESNGIIQSDDVNNSKWLSFCRRTNLAMLSHALSNCEKCIFCSNLEGKSYMIFNQPVDKTTFETVWNSLSQLLNQKTMHICKAITTDKFLPVQPQTYPAFSNEIYKELIDLYPWIKENVPNYDPLTAYGIVLLPEFLTSQQKFDILGIAK